MILFQDYVDEMTWDVERFQCLEKEEGNGEREEENKRRSQDEGNSSARLKLN